MHGACRKFLVSRACNQVRCWLSYALSWVGGVRVRHTPVFVSVEPADYCQLRCPECPVGQSAAQGGTPRPRHTMSLALFQRILEEVQAGANTMQFYFQGEPLLNTHLPEMIAAAHRAGLYTIVSTNAQALTEEMAECLVAAGLRRIIVSVDGFTPASYTAYRVGGQLDRATAALRFLQQAKRAHHAALRIELQVLRLSSNENEWQWIRRNYRSLGATHLTFKTAQLYDYQHGNPLMPTQPRYSRYRLGSDQCYHLHRPHPRSCYRLWAGCVITATGNVLPCCYDKAAQHPLGNIAAQPIAALWQGTVADTFRRRVLHYLQGQRRQLPSREKASFPCRECYY